MGSEKKLRQKAEKLKKDLKSVKHKFVKTVAESKIQEELVGNTKAQLKQMEQLARLSQTMHLEERKKFEKDIVDKENEIAKLKGHLRQIIAQVRKGNTQHGSKRSALNNHGHIRQPIGRKGSQTMNARQILARARSVRDPNANPDDPITDEPYNGEGNTHNKVKSTSSMPTGAPRKHRKLRPPPRTKSTRTPRKSRPYHVLKTKQYQAATEPSPEDIVFGKL